MYEVTLEVPTKANMLCLILRQVLRRNLQTAQAQRVVGKLDGSLHVKAGRMKAVLNFTDGNVRVLPASERPATASIEGSLASLAESGSLLASILGVLKGKVRVRGSFSFAMKAFKLLKPV